LSQPVESTRNLQSRVTISRRTNSWSSSSRWHLRNSIFASLISAWPSSQPFLLINVGNAPRLRPRPPARLWSTTDLWSNVQLTSQTQTSAPRFDLQTRPNSIATTTSSPRRDRARKFAYADICLLDPKLYLHILQPYPGFNLISTWIRLHPTCNPHSPVVYFFPTRIHFES